MSEMTRESYGDGAHIQKIELPVSSALLLSIALSCISLSFGVFCLYQLSKTERRYDLVDNDWQQMNAFLERQGVMKDANGFYILKKER